MTWVSNITGLDKEGIFRSLNGAANENIFIGRASKAGFFCFFKVWRDMPYDAVLDHNGVLYRIEIKGSGTGSFNVTHGSRSGKQIKRNENRTHILTRQDCDFVVGVDTDNGDCYIIPEDIVEIYQRTNLSVNAVQEYREKWDLFKYNDQRLAKENTRDGLRECPIEELRRIADRMAVSVPKSIKPRGTIGLRITDPHDILVISIWKHLAELADSEQMTND